MKYLIATLAIALSINLSGQKLSYSDGSIMYDDEMVQTINVKLNPNVETIKDKFEDWMDDKYDVDLDGTKLLFFDKNYMTANGVVVPKISDRKIDLKVKVDETEAGYTKLDVFASYGYNNWITKEKYPREFMGLRNVVYEFVNEYLPEYYAEKLKDEKEVLADLTDDRKDLKEDMADNKEDIAELEKENQELMKKIEMNQEKINESKRKVSTTTSEYETVKRKVKKMN